MSFLFYRFLFTQGYLVISKRVQRLKEMSEDPKIKPSIKRFIQETLFLT